MRCSALPDYVFDDIWNLFLVNVDNGIALLWQSQIILMGRMFSILTTRPKIFTQSKHFFSEYILNGLTDFSRLFCNVKRMWLSARYNILNPNRSISFKDIMKTNVTTGYKLLALSVLAVSLSYYLLRELLLMP